MRDFATAWCLMAVGLAVGCGSNADVGGRGDSGAAANDAADAADAPAAVTPELSCQAYCQRTSPLPCAKPAADCQQQCLLSRGFAPWCDAAGAASFDCLTKLPDASFMCDGADPQPIKGACGEARDAFEHCVFEGPLPDMSSDCAAYSTLLTNASTRLGCGQPLTKEQCLVSVMDSLPCNGALAVFIHCVAARQPPSAFQCDQGVVTLLPDSPCAPYAWPLGLCIGGF